VLNFPSNNSNDVDSDTLAVDSLTRGAGVSNHQIRRQTFSHVKQSARLHVLFSPELSDSDVAATALAVLKKELSIQFRTTSAVDDSRSVVGVSVQRCGGMF
jgi:hypothetical protein